MSEHMQFILPYIKEVRSVDTPEKLQMLWTMNLLMKSKTPKR